MNVWNITLSVNVNAQASQVVIGIFVKLNPTRDFVTELRNVAKIPNISIFLSKFL